MTSDALKALQAPLKQKYRDQSELAVQTMIAEGTIGFENITCRLESPLGDIEAGLHPAAGGPGHYACSGDMLLQALVGCAGVTLSAVATAMQLRVRGGTIRAEGDVDFRGTLGVAKEVPVGFTGIRLSFALDTDASPEQLDQLLKLTKRYCVVYQTLANPPIITNEMTAKESGERIMVAPLVAVGADLGGES